MTQMSVTSHVGEAAKQEIAAKETRLDSQVGLGLAVMTGRRLVFIDVKFPLLV